MMMSENQNVNTFRVNFFLILVSLLLAGFPSEGITQRLPLRNYSVKEGLPQSQISGIVQDQKGYLWLGTAEGLTSFDGQQFTHYTKKDGLAESLIMKIFLDSKGDIWLGHRAFGISRYNSREERFEIMILPDGLQKTQIRDITETSKGIMFFASATRGLLRYDQEKWSIYNRENGLSTDNLNVLYAEGERVWIGSDKGLILFDPHQKEGNQFNLIPLPRVKSDISISALLKDKQGNLWICTDEGRIFSVKTGKDSLVSVKNMQVSFHPEFPVFMTECVYLDKSGNIWFGSKENGVMCFNPDPRASEVDRLSIITSENGLDSYDVTAIYEDREGSFWFGTNGGGVYQYRGRSLELFGKQEGLTNEVIWSIYEDQKGNFWLGSQTGLTRIRNIDANKGIWQTDFYACGQKPNNNCIIDIAGDDFGDIWVAIHRTGARVFNPITGDFRRVPGLDEKNIICIEKGSEQELWFGTFFQGVFRFNQKTGEIINYRAEDGLGSNTIFTILRARNGDLWFATNGSGVTKFNGTSFEIVDKEKGLPALSVLSLAEDSKGTLWIGSEGDGLFRYDGRTFQNYSQLYGVWSEDIYSIVCDDDDQIFIGTRRGIEKIDPENGRSKKYGENEGFSAIETNQNAAYKDKKGRLWFGTINGVLRYNPHEDKQNIVKPITSINNIRIYLENVPLPADAVFSHSDNHLTFHFSSLSFVAPEKIRFSYMLDGLDRGWSPLTEERTATYANLSPGDYMFQVQSVNNDGIWSENAAVYAFSIAAPFWQTSWFYFLILVLLGISVYGTHHFQVRKIYRNNQLLEKMVHARTVDISNEKEKAEKAYAALQETEKKLMQVTSSLDAYLWSLGLDEDQNLISTFITETFFRMIGYQKHELPPAEEKIERFIKITHHEDQNLVREAYQSAIRGNTVNISFRICDKKGNYQWHYNHAFPVKNKTGHVVLIHGVGFDVTVRKLAEQALRKSEEKYATFMRYSTEAIWCIDMREPIPTHLPVDQQIELIFKNGYLADCNDAMANLYGYESAIEIIGLPLSSSLLKDNPENKNYLQQFVESEYRIKSAEFREIDRHSRLRIFLVSFVGILENDQLVRSWGMQRDITQQKQAEQALKESEEMYRRLIERSPDAIIVHSEGIIDYINQSGIAMYGGERADQFIGRQLTDFSHPQFHELGRQRVQQIYTEKKEVGLIEQKMIRLDGIEFDVEVMGAPIIYKGKASGQSIVRDITEKKKMEAEIQKAQKLESVGLLAGGIAHDFNNILTAILGNISLAKMYAHPQSEAQSMLTQAENATLQAKDLTQQLLTFSKGGAPVKETTSIFEVVKESANFVLRGSNIEAEFECAQDLWSVDVDTAQMSQVIQNLIINAEQAMPDGKKITIILKNVDLTFRPHPGLSPGKYVEISIIDNGIGIPEEHLPKVFDPYFTTKQKGSGLGLATTYSIIRRHDGHIRIKSKMGMGTEVTIYLPASLKSAFPKQPSNERLLNGKGKILVMDDEVMLRQLAEQFLIYLGYCVKTVPDGEKAIREYQLAEEEGSPYSLVIMDLTIPGGMGGKETIENLKKIDPQVKAIVSSGYSNDPVLSNYEEYGFQAVLSKPYKIETMSAVISKVINHQTPS
jgi:PAS domain S-box-containing protein